MKHKDKMKDDIESVKDMMEEVEEPTEEHEDETMSDGEVLSFLTNEVARGVGGNAYGNEEEDVSLAYDYFYGRRPGITHAQNRDTDASRFVSLDVMDAIEATVAEIMPTYATEEIAFYNPDSETDEQQAKIESEQVNYIFFNECDGFSILQTGLKDSLLNRNASAKVYWDKRKEVEYEAYEGVDEMSLAQIMQPTSEGEEVEITERETVSVSVEIEGQDIERITNNIKIKRTKTVERPVIESVQPENVIVSGDHVEPTLYNARFVAHENIETQTSLIEQGIPEDVVDKLEDYNTNIEAISRSRTSAEYDYFASDRSVRHIRIFECYALLDYDNDGIAERRKMVYSGGNLISNDPWPNVPLVGGVTTAIPHKYKGLSLFDRIKEIQDAKTPVIRSIIDGTRLAANPRIGVVTGEVNIDDLLTSRTGGTVRMSTPNSAFDFPRAEVPESAYTFLSAMDNLRRERGGSAISTATTAQQLDNQSEQSFERTMSAMELANAQLARTFAETFIRGIFVQMHNVIRENYKGKLNTKVGGKWVGSIPSEWQKRTGVTVSIGASNAERARQQGAMGRIIDLQASLQEKGSIMFEESRAYKAITNAISLAGVKAPESYFVDPTSDEGKQAQQQQEQAKQQEQEKQSNLEQAMVKAQNDLSQAELGKARAANTAQEVKYENDRLKNELEEIKTLLKTKADEDQMELDNRKLNEATALKITELELKHEVEVSKRNEEVL